MRSHPIVLISILLLITPSFCQFDLQDYGVILDTKHKNKYHWGTYKPNLYFAMKTRKNTSDVFGMMWHQPSHASFKVHGDLATRMRHECKQEDKINYLWEYHNGIDYGSQVIEDTAQNNLKLETKFLKRDYNTSSNQKWDVHIKASSLSENQMPNITSLILYFAMEEFEIREKSFYSINLGSNSTTFAIVGNEKGKEKYHISVDILSEDQLISSSYQKYRKLYNETWRVKKFISDELKEEEATLAAANKTWEYVNFQKLSKTNQPNMVAIQYVFKPPFDILIHFSQNVFDDANENHKLSLEEMSLLFKQKESEFNEKFSSVFPIDEKKAEGMTRSNDVTEFQSLVQMGREALSNLLGGIGYFYGAIKINLDDSKLTAGGYHKGFRYAVEPKGLFTATPSRGYFARGFLWDEGFHNAIISLWERDISIDILDSWLSTMSATGWMPREQIRGAEAQAQVPSEFITQDKMIGNPPTFIFAIENIMKYYKYFSERKHSQYVNSFLKKCFDKLGLWYEWLEVYQKAPDHKSYQWYGRDSNHNYPSGLDDFPRGMTPNIYERHLDLNMWVIELMKTLMNLSEIFDVESVGHFEKLLKKQNDEMKKMYFDESTGLYSDYLGPQFKLIESSKFKRKVPPYLWRGDGMCGGEAKNPIGTRAECNPYSDAPCCSEFGWCGSTANHCNCEKCSRSLKLEDRESFKKKENIYNPHVGYVNLFPIMFGLLKSEDKVFRTTLQYLKEKDELLSQFGIRSLSRNDLLYHTGEDYWRGNIWINMNYLVLRGLYKYYKDDAEAMEVYSMIRTRLIGTVYKTWKKTRTFFEQYSDITGEGTKNHPFNGWTSLILNILSEKYEY